MNPDRDPLLLRRQMIRAGSTDGEIRAATRKGALERVRRGAFTSSGTRAASTPEEFHLLQVRAHAAAATSPLVVSHQSAAVVHGLPRWSPDLNRVHFTVARPNGGRRSRTRHIHPAALMPADVVNLRGIAVTTPERTVADLCKSLEFEAAVCVGDGALGARIVTRDGVAQALNRSGRRSIAKALRALDFCTDLSESVGESRTRVRLNSAGMPQPTLQVDVYILEGVFLARVDFMFEELGVILEFDGNIEYAKHWKPGQSAGDAVIAEKKREDGLRSYGWVIVRIYWSDLEHPERLVEKLQRAFDLARTQSHTFHTTAHVARLLPGWS